MATLVFELLDRQLQGVETLPRMARRRYRGGAGHIGHAGRRQPHGGNAWSRFLHHLAIQPADTLGNHRKAPARLRAGRLRGVFLQPAFAETRLANRHGARYLARVPPGEHAGYSRPATDAPEDESIRVVELQHLDAKDVDMFTLVSVGNSESRHIVNKDRTGFTRREATGKNYEGLFYWRGSRRPGTHYRQGAETHQSLPGDSLCRLVGATGDLRRGGGQSASLIMDTASMDLEQIMQQVLTARGCRSGRGTSTFG